MTALAELVGRSPHVPPVDYLTGTVEITGRRIHLNPVQFETFLALRAGTPVHARDLADLFHVENRRLGMPLARQRIQVLRKTLAQETGRTDLIELTQFGYRLVLD